MDDRGFSVSASNLYRRLGTAAARLLIDVRRGGDTRRLARDLDNLCPVLSVDRAGRAFHRKIAQ